ncbi:MarR family winged helix-turn-helix transcriptional regulator [Mycobacterium scrofulaceum]|uniref:MarR family transcriptional regulator n=1 Tax=Mycobacterium scrofulaceum TaxID=1783 RepID=A0A1X0KEN8_MYCSC|nr:MarR family transcriptional regulator [Mycobacterium scrofulaceum]ORB73390.1 MarR family transcriptional regulator [Mycobacterium scrofulaceum]
MTKRGATDRRLDRAELEKLMSADMRALTAQSDRIGRHFARQNEVGGTDLHALLHIMVAETAGTPLTPAQLRQRLDVSPAAITYLVDRMIDSGHLRREPDPDDRRKTLLRYEESGMALARSFFTPLGSELHTALAGVPDRDLVAAHRVFLAMMEAMSTFETRLDAAAKAPETDGKRAPAKGRRRAVSKTGDRPA